MARKSDVPKNLEIWTGGPKGLRLRKHPRLAEALRWLDEYPMVIRKPTVFDKTSLAPDSVPGIGLAALPVYAKSSVGEAIHLRLELDLPVLATWRPEQFARVFITTDDTVLEEHLVVKSGKRQFLILPFPAYECDTQFTVSIDLRQEGESGKATQSFILKPEKRLTFYYSFQTHLDLGWTDRVAPVVESLKAMTLTTAMDVCNRFKDRPEGERFIWVCECSDALRLAWDGAVGEEKETLRELVRDGYIQSCALPYSFHMGLMSHDLLRRSLERSFALRREMGLDESLDLSVVQNNDVPGHSWILPDVLAETGIKRAVIGHNHMVRGCHLPPLFLMRGPGGHDVLTLATSCVDYGTERPVPQRPGEFYAIAANNPEATPMPGTAYLRSIGYGENCGPEGAQREIDAISAWNETYAWPKLVIGSPKDYFNHIEQELDLNDLPVVDQEISDWWIDGPASTPVAMADFRRVMQQLPEIAKLVPADAAEDQARLAIVEENLILHAEHTFGMNAQLVKVTAAQQGWSTTGLDKYQGSWEDKELYATRAKRVVAELLVTYPLPAPTSMTSPGNWTIEWDTAGISRLSDPIGNAWYDRTMATDDALPFGVITQRLLDVELDEWFHHNPPAAEAPGDYPMTVTSVTRANDSGVRLNGKLDSPAGAIADIVIDIVNDSQTEDLLIHAKLTGKAATAQAEVLALALPFTVEQPSYRVDVGNAFLRVDDDQRPDANRDAHPSITGWVMENPAADISLAVSSAEAFLWHFGGLRYCDWNVKDTPRNGTVYAHLCNNAWNTNFRCWFGGDLDLTIRLRSCPQADLNSLSDMANRWSPDHK